MPDQQDQDLDDNSGDGQSYLSSGHEGSAALREEDASELMNDGQLNNRDSELIEHGIENEVNNEATNQLNSSIIEFNIAQEIIANKDTEPANEIGNTTI
jgi:hypothetical protein